jgi:acetyl-CoA synthetase
MLDMRSITDWATLRDSFRWVLPDTFNIAESVCGRHARDRPGHPAVVVSPEEGEPTTVTFAELDDLVARVAGGLVGLGIGRGDRVAIRLDQGVPSLASLLAALRIGAIAVPIPPAFAADAVAYRLRDSGARVLIAEGDGLDAFHGEVAHIVTLDPDGALPEALLDVAPADPVETVPDDSALLFYTSGSTGPPKGVLHGHRLLLGHLPGFQLMFDLAPDEDDVYWTPSVWAWQGSLGDLVLPALHFGCPVVATPGRFSTERVHRTLATTGITRAFLATAVLRRLVLQPPDEPPSNSLRAICTGGDPLPPGFGAEVTRLFGVGVNDDYGLTETSHVAAGCNALYPTPEGAIGRLVPGRRVVILDDDLRPVAVGEEGQIASSADDPITMLGYWGRPEATGERLVDGWCLTGDRGRLDGDGYLWYLGRMGQTMKVSGQVVGPEEVEAALRAHPCVAEVCVFAEPDPVLGDRPVAVVELGPGWVPGESLAHELQLLAREHLARFAYPRRVVFEEFPRNTSGKIDRSATKERFAERG